MSRLQLKCNPKQPEEAPGGKFGCSLDDYSQPTSLHQLQVNLESKHNYNKFVKVLSFMTSFVKVLIFTK